MTGTPSLMRLHLRYRLWIAEMNEDITVLRIFDDHLAELQAISTEVTLPSINKFKQEFADFRTEIDGLKHEMHLHKMTIAALVREGKGNTAISNAEEHEILKTKYEEFCKRFENAKKAFVDFD